MRTGRKAFIFSFYLTALVFTISEAQQKPGPIHVLVKGKVREEGKKGIPNVVVTDGTNVVRTNGNGEYALQSTNESRFVYISIPSGYEIPNDNGVVQFYKKIDAGKRNFTADFSLKKLSRSDKKHYTILWADPQINNLEQAAQLHATAVPDTKAHIEELEKSGPVHGIAAGDISWDAPPIIPEYIKAVKTVGIPFFQVLGNHDMNINVRSDERTDSSFRESFGPAWYSFNRGEAHYVVLDNVFYYSDGYNYLGYINERQLKWLEQDLAAVKPGSLVFVSMHISAYTEEKRRYKRDNDKPGSITFNRRFLFDLLKPFKAHLLTGHTHYNENRTEGGVYEHIHGALCASWWSTPLCDDGTPGGYGVYEIDGTEVKWYYKSIGHSKDHQFRAYNRGSYLKKPKDIAVNVWNWDKDWKVTWYEDGIMKGEMRQEVDFDAGASALMAGKDKPKVYPWIEPRLTDHLFFATPSDDAREVTIEVRDRFGKIYKEVIKLK
jgi:hypothetical protein